jgi:hypothetical protein
MKQAFKTVEDVIQFCRMVWSYEEPLISEFHKRTGLARSTIKNLIDGETKSPHLKTVIRFLAGFGYRLSTVEMAKGKKLRLNKRKTVAAR